LGLQPLDNLGVSPRTTGVFEPPEHGDPRLGDPKAAGSEAITDGGRGKSHTAL
jgi:hypothetical protein